VSYCREVSSLPLDSEERAAKFVLLEQALDKVADKVVDKVVPLIERWAPPAGYRYVMPPLPPDSDSD
jgi:hypothetical protein